MSRAHAATKRRLRRAQWRRHSVLGRLDGRYPYVLGLWPVVLVLLLVVGYFVVHYVTSRHQVELTVHSKRITSGSGGENVWSVETSDGRTYAVGGLRPARVYTSLREGRRYRCRARGIGLIYLREITSCRPLAQGPAKR